MFTQFLEGNLLSETRDDAESGEESDDDSIMLPRISEEETDMIYSCDDSEDKTRSMEMLEDIHDGSKYHTSVNRR